MTKAVIITEGGKKIGLGHLARCISLYRAFEKKKISPVLIINGDKTAEDVLAGYDCRIFNWLKHKQRLFDIAKDSDIAVIDSYIAGAGIYKRVSNFAKAAVYLDDNMRMKYPRGIVVNGSISAELMKYQKSNGVEYLLGSRYILLRKEFWAVPAKRINGKIKSIMVTFGGADGRNMTPKVIDFLNTRYPSAEKNVIVGAGFKNSREIERLKDKKVNLIYSPDTKKMRAAMLKSNIAISAAGQTLCELARIGVPTIAVCAADNQFRGVKGWQKSGFIRYAGKHSNKGLFNKLSSAITELEPSQKRRKVSAIGRSLVDGKGAQRVTKAAIAAAKKVRVMLTCVGGKFSRNTVKLLKESKDPEITVIGVDSGRSIGCIDGLQAFHIVPRGSDKVYIPKLLELCGKESVDIVIPCADEEVAKIAAFKSQFDGAGITCAVDGRKTVALTNDKFALFEHLSRNGINMPRYKLIKSAQELKKSAAYFGYPKEKFVIKPRCGRGTRHTFIIGNDGESMPLEEALNIFGDLPTNLMAMEYLSGEAYDVDVLAREGNPLCIVPRRRTWLNKLSPFSEGCEVENNEDVTEFVKRITLVLKLNYAYDFDCGITAKGKPALYEINPRFSGAIAASAGAGINMPVMLVRMMRGLDIPKMRIKFGTKMIPKPNGGMDFVRLKTKRFLKENKK
ncbi:MAG: ATP-grasp domain-containing protein [Candidatus Omnitrophota bacterium]